MAARPKSIKQIVENAKSASQLNIDFQREYGRVPNVNEGNDLSNLWMKKTRNTSSVSTGTSPMESDTPKSEGKISGTFNVIEKTLGFLDDKTKFLADSLSDVYQSQMGKGSSGDDTTQKLLNLFKGGITGMLSDTSSAVFKEITEQLLAQSKLLSDVNSKTGMSGELSEKLRDDMISAQGEAKKYGFELSDIGEFYTDLSAQSGKFSLINRETIVDAAKTAAALNMSMSDLAESIGNFENVGIGAKETTKAIGDAAVRSISLGLNARKVADGMKESIGKLNEYGFKNGVLGLERMVQKSIEFKISMDKVASIADKVMNPDGAIDLAANLQVLGGAIGSFGDPIKMMYDATNNMEGLQDSLIGAAKGLATYNQQQGRFEITGINLRRGREMASALGMTMEELGRTAVAAQERVAASTALMSTGLKMEDKDREFLTNLSRMQDGQMKIVIPESLQDKLGKQTALSLTQLTEDQKKVLLANKEAFEKMNPEKIAMSQLTETQQIGRNMDAVAAYIKIRAANFLKGAAGEAIKKQMTDLQNKIAGIDTKISPKQAENAGKNMVQTFANEGFISGVKNLYDGLKSEVQSSFGLNKDTNTNSQSSPQVIQQNVHVTSDVNSDYFNQVIKKDAAFAFEFKNTRGYDVLTPVKRKGK